MLPSNLDGEIKKFSFGVTIPDIAQPGEGESWNENEGQSS